MRILANIVQMALIDLKKIYRGTLFGWIWLIAKPVTTIFVYWFAFSVGLRLSTSVNGHHYFFWLVSGTLPWMYISEILSTSPGVFKKYNYLVTKIKYPIIAIPIFTSLSRLIVHILVLLLFITIYSFTPAANINMLFQLLILIPITFLLMSSLAIILSFIGSISKDLAEFIKTIVTPLLFLSPVFWDINTMSIEWLVFLQKLNPFAFIVSSYRNIFIYNRVFYGDMLNLLMFSYMFALISSLSVILYTKLRKEIPDYL